MRTAILLALTACNNPPPAAPTAAAPPGAIVDPGETVLTVDGQAIGARELDLVFKRMRVPDDQRAEFAWTTGGKHVAEEYALANQLYFKALERKLQDDPDVQLQLAFAERQVLASAMRAQLAKEEVNDAAIAKYYEDNKARFSKPEVRARQIQVADEQLAKDLFARLKKGEDFAQLAKDHSVDPATKGKGGEAGWLHEHENPLWGDAAFAANKGDVLGPLSSRAGWHIVEVLDKRDSTPIEDTKDEARSQLEHQNAVVVIEKIRSALVISWVKEPAADAPAPQPGPGAVAVPGEPPPGGAPGPQGGQMPPNHPAPGGQ
ncbi:MAG: peptidylprolyl isomerase [Myxococcota bacterium]